MGVTTGLNEGRKHSVSALVPIGGSTRVLWTGKHDLGDFGRGRPLVPFISSGRSPGRARWHLW